MTPLRRLHLFILIDALGWQLIEGRDFLSDLLPYRTPLRTVLGYSSGAIPSILTGKSPAEHGHWNLVCYNPESSPFRWLRFFGFIPATLLDHRVTRKLLKEVGRHVLGLGPLFECCVSPRLLPWFDWVEKRNIYDREGIIGASSIFDQLAESGVSYRVYTYHRWTDKEIFQQTSRDLKSREVTFFFLYLSEMDLFLHDHCQDNDMVERKLRWYRNCLRELLECAQEIDPKANFTVFSDHGMTPVLHHFDMVEEVEDMGFTMPTDYLAVYDSTMARFWFFNNRARQEITDHLHTIHCGRIVPDEELGQLGVLFGDRRHGETIFLLRPGWLFSRSDFNGAGWMPAGMHGYHPDDPYSDAIFLNNHEPPVSVHSIVDVHKCMRLAAGLYQ